MKYTATKKSKAKAMTNARAAEPLIIKVRGQRVILDSDLAEIYGVQTKALNQAVKRNAECFPEDFMFQLAAGEWKNLKSQFATTSIQHVYGLEDAQNRSQIVAGHRKHRDPRSLPYAFTEHGAIMAATVLNSPKAVAMSVFVVRAFIQMRERLAANAEILKRLAEIDKTLLEHNDALAMIWEQIQPLLAPPPERPPKQSGFHVKEKRVAYNVRRAIKWPKHGPKRQKLAKKQ
ncbi:MAG: ORF6N domain-containing protein [Kiritimatiellia bacterium]